MSSDNCRCNNATFVPICNISATSALIWLPFFFILRIFFKIKNKNCRGGSTNSLGHIEVAGHLHFAQVGDLMLVLGVAEPLPIRPWGGSVTPRVKVKKKMVFYLGGGHMGVAEPPPSQMGVVSAIHILALGGGSATLKPALGLGASPTFFILKKNP
jgi:hypothetical protein